MDYQCLIWPFKVKKLFKEQNYTNVLTIWYIETFMYIMNVNIFLWGWEHTSDMWNFVRKYHWHTCKHIWDNNYVLFLYLSWSQHSCIGNFQLYGGYINIKGKKMQIIWAFIFISNNNVCTKMNQGRSVNLFFPFTFISIHSDISMLFLSLINTYMHMCCFSISR